MPIIPTNGYNLYQQKYFCHRISIQYGYFSCTQAKILDITMSLIEPHSKKGDKKNFPKFFLWMQTVISKSLPRVCHGKGRKGLGWSNKISEFYQEITN